ncbi:hypothetical protein D9M72_450260 [compost metagenome]
MLAMWMITPPLRSIICGKNFLSRRTGASRFACIVLSQASSSNTAKPPLGVSELPRLFTRISSLPYFPKTSSTTFCVPSGLLKSAEIKCRLSFAVSGAFLAVMITVAPACSSRFAIAFPAPFVPPVTKAILPDNSLLKLNSCSIFTFV